MTGHTRVTVLGERRRLDVVLPSHEPVGVLIPELVELCGEPAGEPPEAYALMTVTGDAISDLAADIGMDSDADTAGHDSGQALGNDQTLAQAGLPDGALVQLVRAVEAPSAAVVHDVNEEVLDDFAVRPWKWGDAARTWTATGLVCLVAVCTIALIDHLTPWLGLTAGALIALGAVLARWVHHDVGVAVVLAGGAVGGFLAWQIAVSPEQAAWLTGLVVCAVFLVLGVSSPLGRGGTIGAIAGGVLLAGWAWVAHLQFVGGRGYAILAAISILALGALPRIALLSSGLAGLDDARVEERTVTRHSARTALTAAHRGLTLATVAIATSAATAGVYLTTTPNRWTVPLAGLTAAALLLRLRAYPLVLQVLALLAGAVAVLAALAIAWLRADPDAYRWIAVFGAVSIVATLLRIAYQPKPHVWARLRQIADKVELLVVLAVVPVVIGEFGVYGQLLNTF